MKNLNKWVISTLAIALVATTPSLYAQNGYGYENSRRSSSRAPYIALGVIAVAAVIAILVHDNDHHHHHDNGSGTGGGAHGHSHG